MATKKHPHFQTPRILHDLPLEKETAHFHFDEFAATLARLVASPDTRTPLTIGISGAWGSGKTTLLQRVRWMLNEPLDPETGLPRFANTPQEAKKFRQCKTVWFDAWKYDDENHLLAALVRVILQAMEKDGLLSRLRKEWENPAQRTTNFLEMFLDAFKLNFGFVEFQLDMAGHSQESPLVSNTAFFDYFSAALEGLIARWVHGQGKFEAVDDQKGALVIFIDDLDRCLPEKTVQVLEAVKLFLDKRGCIFLIGADTSVVRSAVESYYKNTAVTGQNAADYLDKVIQLRYELPPVAAGVMQDYLKAQAVGEEMLSQWQTLIAAAEVNPRRVKAVVNDIELQWQMLANSGQAGQVKRDDFIRFSALLRAAPEAFRQRLDDIDDLDLQWKFLQEALAWAAGQGDETISRKFQDFERFRRLRRVLREIKAFSSDFDAATLDAFIHMAAPPARSEVEIHAPTAQAVAEGLSPQGKGEAARESALSGVRTIGGIEFVPVPAGKFKLGSKDDNPLARDNEKPQHTCEISRPYSIARFPITNARFEEFVQARAYPTTSEEKGSAPVWDGNQLKDTPGANWRHPRGPKSSSKDKEQHPVVQVSWVDAAAYCRWFNETYRAELGDLQVRLPTEAEWEKAARGEYANEWPWGNEWDPQRCNSREGGKGDTTPVGAYSPSGDSPYGAADMVGNAWEWCQDWYDGSEYTRRQVGPVVDPTGPQTGTARVVRGGSWDSTRLYARCASRYGDVPGDFGSNLGFRVALSPG